MQNLSYNTTIYEDYCKMSFVGTVTKEGDRNNKTHKQINLLNNKIYCWGSNQIPNLDCVYRSEQHFSVLLNIQYETIKPLSVRILEMAVFIL